MRPVFPALALLPLLAGCGTFEARTAEQHYWTGQGWGESDRYYAGVKHDHALLYPEPPAPVGTGRSVLLGCDMAGSAVLDTLWLPVDFYLVETDGQKREPKYSEKGYY